MMTKEGMRAHGSRRWPVDPIAYAWEQLNGNSLPVQLRPWIACS